MRRMSAGAGQGRSLPTVENDTEAFSIINKQGTVQ